MINRRFVKSYPDWMGTKIWKNDALFKLYHYCMYKACYTGMKWMGIWLEQGEFPVSQRESAEELGWSVNFLRKNLRALEEMGLITLRTDCRGTVVRLIDPERAIPDHTDVSPDDTRCCKAGNTEESGVSPVDTVCSMGEYTEKYSVSPVDTVCSMGEYTEEYDVSSEDTMCSTARNTENTGVSPDDATCCTAWNTGVSPEDTYIEHIEYKEYKDRQRETYRERGRVCLSDFSSFWQAYPAERRLGREKAARCYDRAIRSGATPEMLMMILAEDKASAVWRKENGRYIPGMAKWFAREKWRERMPAPRERKEEPWKPR